MNVQGHMTSASPPPIGGTRVGHVSLCLKLKRSNVVAHILKLKITNTRVQKRFVVELGRLFNFKKLFDSSGVFFDGNQLLIILSLFFFMWNIYN